MRFISFAIFCLAAVHSLAMAVPFANPQANGTESASLVKRATSTEIHTKFEKILRKTSKKYGGEALLALFNGLIPAPGVQIPDNLKDTKALKITSYLSAVEVEIVVRLSEPKKKHGSLIMARFLRATLDLVGRRKTSIKELDDQPKSLVRVMDSGDLFTPTVLQKFDLAWKAAAGILFAPKAKLAHPGLMLKGINIKQENGDLYFDFILTNSMNIIISSSDIKL